jgi:hypothetical protein
MNCTCGYSFSEKLAKGIVDFEEFAFIRRIQYKKFLKAEVKILKQEDKLLRLDSIAHASKYVGSGMICPLCKRLLLVLPGGGPVMSYHLENMRGQKETVKEG